MKTTHSRFNASSSDNMLISLHRLDENLAAPTVDTDKPGRRAGESGRRGLSGIDGDVCMGR
jgi:hypothetical protein